MINILVKKLAAFILDSEIEVRFWEMKRWGFWPGQQFKKPFPIGLVLPIIVTVLSYGYIYWLGSLIFDVKGKVYRAAKRYGLYKFSEVTEWHIGWIAAWGVIANLFFAIVGYIFGFPEFARLNIYFAFFNLIPFSSLDGNKIFFGSVTMWALLAILTLIGVGYAFLLV
jgi:Zn-dependent protease